ncbi:MAG: ATP-binding cassette domain-containing protein [Acidimicrobiales bacterium]|nr:ATP-binding cassette domain-containing protein [Acidimicrobiales bacterium]
MTLGFEVTRQFVFMGGVNGLSYALLALGVILIYRSSRVINFSVGAAGVLAGQVLAHLVIVYDVPYWAGVALAIAAGAGFLGLAELTVGRRLFNAPRVILLVATIGLAQLAEALVFAFPDPSDDEISTDYPTPWTREFEWFGIELDANEVLLVVVSLITVVTIGMWLRTSAWGRAIRASAANPDRARLAGINPGTVSTIVWMLAGGFAAMVTILDEAGSGRAFISESPGPALMTRVLVVAVLASFVSFPRAVAAGLVLGIVEQLTLLNYDDDGRFEAILLLVAVVGVFLTTRRAATDERESFSFAPRVRPIPESIRDIWWVRHHTRLIGGVAILLAFVVPIIVTTPSRNFRYTEIMLLGLAALSLVVLVGWSGQISLGQAAFAGFGALSTAALVRGQDIGIGGFGHDVTLPLPELHFLWALVWATLLSAAIAVAIGLGALRVKGLLLAVVTLGLAVASAQYFFARPFLGGGSTSSAFLEIGEIGPFDPTDRRHYYWFSLAALVLAVTLIAHVRRSGIGRRIIATRENEDAAASFTIRPTGSKLLSFAIGGGVAGFAGGLLGGTYQSIQFELFSVSRSIDILAIAVIGGVGSVAGPILGALWVIGLPVLLGDSLLIGLLTSSLGILILLMYAPGGFVQFWFLGRDTFLAWYADRRDAAPPARPAIPVQVDIPPPPSPVALDARCVRVRFGEREAVAGVDLRVDHGEIVGLIGTNGAGKTTFMNAVGGMVPADGTVEIYGTDVTGMSAHRRHRHHLGRTFQTATLFPDLTVKETVQVALETRMPTRLRSSFFPSPIAAAHERRQSAAADELIGFLGLGDYANSFIGELSTGTRRIVELTCLVAGGSRLLCLDEPTAGVAQREAEALVPLLKGIRRELDASVLLIEHDMPLILSLSDRVYCLEQGRVIADGTPAEIRDNPAVVASYLGTDERAIDRSDVGSTP